VLTTTNTLLLEGLGDPANETVWREFHARYRPVIVGFARRLGLSPEDAEDAAQETLARFVRDYRDGRYQRERGRLRSWIFTIARSRALDLRRKGAGRAGWRGESALGAVPAEDAVDQLWSEEWRRAVVRRAFVELRAESRAEPKTVRALELLVLEGRTPRQVADELGLSVDSVYVAKHRLLGRLRAILARLEEEF
jgi:RNA polymerase sigma-70 factor (ECF subfamily)